tara:strand:- start:65 stop:472 length:408 start_codon:yes stop_codon:yes gene_type:complete
VNINKKTKFIIIITIFLAWMHYIQTAELSSELLTIFMITKKMIGIIVVLSIFASIIVGYLFFIKYSYPNLTEAELKAIKEKLKRSRNINKLTKRDYNLQSETKSLVEKLRKLKHLYKNGSLTKIEFERAKDKVLK